MRALLIDMLFLLGGGLIGWSICAFQDWRSRRKQAATPAPASKSVTLSIHVDTESFRQAIEEMIRELNDDDESEAWKR